MRRQYGVARGYWLASFSGDFDITPALAGCPASGPGSPPLGPALRERCGSGDRAIGLKGEIAQCGPAEYSPQKPFPGGPSAKDQLDRDVLSLSGIALGVPWFRKIGFEARSRQKNRGDIGGHYVWLPWHLADPRRSLRLAPVAPGGSHWGTGRCGNRRETDSCCMTVLPPFIAPLASVTLRVLVQLVQLQCASRSGALPRATGPSAMR
jgi:hypothetical protein